MLKRNAAKHKLQMTDGFITITDRVYMPGAQALVHSIRRWYPFKPIVIGCIGFKPGARRIMIQFAKRHRNVRLMHLDVPDHNPYPWYYKTKTILGCGLKQIVYLDADCLLTYYIPEVWQYISEGMLWTIKAIGKAPGMFKAMLEDADEDMHKYMKANPSYLLQTGNFGLDVDRWRGFLEEWDELCSTPSLYKKSYGDMGFFNYLIVKNNLYHKVQYSDDNAQYGAIGDYRFKIKYKDGLVTISEEESKGIVKLVHYIAKKPWFVARMRSKNMPRQCRRLKNSDAMHLWLDVIGSVRKGNKAWIPTI